MTKTIVAGLLFSILPRTAHANVFFDCANLLLKEQAQVCQAHSAFLNGNLDEMMTSVKEALQGSPGDSVVGQNLFSLMGEAYLASGGKLPGDFASPKGVESLKIRVKRRLKADTGSVRYSFTVAAQVLEPGTIDQLRLTRLQDPSIVLEKKQGEFEESKDSDGSLYYVAWSEPSSKAPPEGLYELYLRTSAGDEVKSVLVLSQMSASASPSVLRPAPQEVIRGSFLEVDVKDFVSSEFAGFEKRKLAMVVIDESKDQAIWESDAYEPRAQKAKLGPFPEGRYRLMVGFSEARRQGAVKLDRESATYIPFRIAK